MDEYALAALYVARDAIRKAPGINEATADNDHKSGEIIFTTANGTQYRLKLEEITDGV